jgi:hypothetical protein
MELVSKEIADRFRGVYFGGNYTSSSFQDHIADVDWKMATKQFEGVNNIATLTHHLSYFVREGLDVLKGKKPDTNPDSFRCPPFNGSSAWHEYKTQVIIEGERFAKLLEELPDSQLEEDYIKPEYGSYYHNLHGIIEHTHYHLGQIVLLKKLIKLNHL